MASGPLDRLLQFRRYAEVDDGFGIAQALLLTTDDRTPQPQMEMLQ